MEGIVNSQYATLKDSENLFAEVESKLGTTPSGKQAHQEPK